MSFKVTLRKNGRPVGEMCYPSEAVAVTQATAMTTAAPGTTASVSTGTKSNPRRNPSPSGWAVGRLWFRGPRQDQPVLYSKAGHPNVEQNTQGTWYVAGHKVNTVYYSAADAMAVAETMKGDAYGQMKSNPRRNGATSLPKNGTKLTDGNREGYELVMVKAGELAVGDRIIDAAQRFQTVTRLELGKTGALLAHTGNLKGVYEHPSNAHIKAMPRRRNGGSALTAHQLSALAWIARYPGTDARTARVGVATADALERLGLVTVTRELGSERVRVSPLTARTGTRMRTQTDVGVILTDAGHAALKRNGASAHICRNPGCGCRANPRRNAGRGTGFHWEKGDTSNEWTLLLNGEPVADLVRAYSEKWGGAGKGRVADASKPMFWTLVPWRGSSPSVKPCRDGATVAEAKAAAESIMRGRLKSNPRRNGETEGRLMASFSLARRLGRNGA